MTNSNKDIIAGKYKLEKIVGLGAHGEVYKAKIQSTDTFVAIKIFYQHLDHEILKYILKELEIISSLSHPHILKVIAFGRGKRGEELVHYMVTPFMGCMNLSEMIQKEQFEIFQCIDITLKIARALDYMHSNLFVHRDVKPQNILSNEKKNFVLADFGIACTSGQTQVSAVGTMDYCAPEQLDNSGAKAKPTLDVYSLGITLYEMLTGINPFRKITEKEGQAAAIKFKYVNEYPQVTTYNPNISLELAKVIEKMVASNEERRYQSMKQVITALTPFASQETLDHESFTPHIGNLFQKALDAKQEKKWDKALSLYQNIIEDMPENSQALNYQGDILIQKKLYIPAIEKLNLAIFYNPEYYSAYCRRCQAYFHIGEFRKALSDIMYAISLYPERSEAYFYKALLHRKHAHFYRERGQETSYKKQAKFMKTSLRKYETLKKFKEE